MEFSTLTNEVLRLLLAQNNLPIAGNREQLIKRLSSIDPSASSSTNPNVPTRTRSSSSSTDSAAKRSRTGPAAAAAEGSNSDEAPPAPILVSDGATDRDRANEIGGENQDGGRTGGVPLSDRSAQRKFLGFAWLSYDIDFRRKAASNLALNWGERDIQIYLIKFTAQAKSSCTICGSGEHSSYGCSLSALRPNSAQRGVCHNFNCGSKCADSLSRFQMTRFRLLAPDASPVPCPIPPSLTKV